MRCERRVACGVGSGRPRRKAPKGEGSSCSRQDLWDGGRGLADGDLILLSFLRCSPYTPLSFNPVIISTSLSVTNMLFFLILKFHSFTHCFI